MNSLKDIIKRHFPHLDSGTISVEDKKFVVVSAHKKPKFSNEWPRERPKHLTFHLCKEGMDTVHVFGQLARELGMSSSHVIIYWLHFDTAIFCAHSSNPNKRFKTNR